MRGYTIGKDDEKASEKGEEMFWKHHASTNQCVGNTPKAKKQEDMS